jgi:hypothetical protein
MLKESIMNKEYKDVLVDLAMAFYYGEPCRICGKELTKEDGITMVWAGTSKDSKARCAHKECWDKGLPESEWVHQ